jgi:hypothetical protein
MLATVTGVGSSLSLASIFNSSSWMSLTKALLFFIFLVIILSNTLSSCVTGVLIVISVWFKQELVLNSSPPWTVAWSDQSVSNDSSEDSTSCDF